MVATVVAESEFIKTETFVSATVENLDVYQTAIFDFIMTSKSELSIEAQLEIAMAISNFDSTMVIESNFAEIFVAIFSESSTFYSDIVVMSTSSTFVAIETVANVFSAMSLVDVSFNVLDVSRSSMAG